MKFIIEAVTNKGRAALPKLAKQKTVGAKCKRLDDDSVEIVIKVLKRLPYHGSFAKAIENSLETIMSDYDVERTDWTWRVI